MGFELRTKLLRLIELDNVQPVVANQEAPVDLRFICATNRNPLDDIADRQFRKDLHHRLHIILS